MTRTHYVWDPFEDNVIEECDENGDTLVRYTTEPDLYGNLISQERDGAASYYHFDGQGNTLALTNSAGAIIAQYSYTGFGEITLETTMAENSRRFGGEVGYEWNVETTDNYVRCRPYSPSSIRWLSIDPIGYQAHDLNLYRYVFNRPIIFNDPSGTQAKGCTKCYYVSGRFRVRLRDVGASRVAVNNWNSQPPVTKPTVATKLACISDGTQYARYRCFNVCTGKKYICVLDCGYILIITTIDISLELPRLKVTGAAAPVKFGYVPQDAYRKPRYKLYKTWALNPNTGGSYKVNAWRRCRQLITGTRKGIITNDKYKQKSKGPIIKRNTALWKADFDALKPDCQGGCAR